MTKAVDMRRKKEDPIGQGTLIYGETLALWGISRKLQDRVFLVQIFFKEEAPNAGTPVDPVNSNSSPSPASSISFFYESISGRRSFSFSMRLKKRRQH